MARSIDDIERDIERSRKQLATTLDQLAERTKPANVVEETKRSIAEKLRDPRIRNIAVGVAAVAAGIVVVGLAARHRNNRQLKELRDLLAA